jgi:hypothetical protein
MAQASESLPRFNHVAMSVPADLLGEKGRAELLAFYAEVFGWDEMPSMTKDREIFVLRAHRNDQFVFLVADEEPMTCPKLDHFGMSVAKSEDLDAILARAKKYREKDPRVEIVDREIDDHGVVKLHSFYVRYLLPMMVEVQHFEWIRPEN